MKTKILGKGEPEHAVMYCVHGNEPCGKLAVDRIMHENLDFKKPVKLVFANEKAFNEGVSHVDEDLNRAWHSSRRETHEKKLEKKIREEIEGLNVLDLHSSFSHPEAFGLNTENSSKVEDQIGKLGLKQTADISSVYSNQIENVQRTAVECGYTRTQKTIENAYRITKNYLKSNNIISGETESRKPDRYRIYDKVEGENWQFIKKNFNKVKKGEKYAIRGKDELKAEEDFYPVMMSTTGYDDMIGFKAKKLEEGE